MILLCSPSGMMAERAWRGSIDLVVHGHVFDCTGAHTMSFPDTEHLHLLTVQ